MGILGVESKHYFIQSQTGQMASLANFKGPAVEYRHVAISLSRFVSTAEPFSLQRILLVTLFRSIYNHIQNGPFEMACSIFHVKIVAFSSYILRLFRMCEINLMCHVFVSNPYSSLNGINNVQTVLCILMHTIRHASG